MKKRVFSFAVCLAMLLSLLSCPGTAMDIGASEGAAGPALETDDLIHYIHVNTEYNNDCFLIESNGEYMLVDTSNPDLGTGGSQAVIEDTATVNEAIRYLDHLGVTTLDYVVLTHNHSDHIGGVGRLCQTGHITSDTTVYYRSSEHTIEDIIYPYWENALYLRRALDALNEVGAQVVCLADEQITDLTVQLGDFTVDFLNLDMDGDGVVDFDHDNENNNSIVLKVTKGSVDTLLTGDIEQEVELALAEQLGQVEVLKAPHHGNRTSSSYEFMKAIQPETVIVTSSGLWQYGAYEYLHNIGSSIYALGLSPGLAIIEAVMEDSYEIIDGREFFTTASEGWHEWLDHYYYVEGAQVVRDDWKKISGDWYYFNEDGVMQTGQVTVDGVTYSLSDTGELIDE